MQKRKTFIINISDLNETWTRFEKRTKREVKRCRENVFITDDINEFNRLHLLTRPDRKIDAEFIKKTYLERQPDCKIYATKTAMAMIGWNKTTGYYLLAARDKTISDGSPSKILWKAMQDLNGMGIKEIDLCGANKPNIIMFKKGFGGELKEQCQNCLVY